MPVELVSRVDLDSLYGPFLEQVLEVLARCRARGANYYLTYGFRSPAEQLALWAQGRTSPGSIVTGAGPYQSMHQFGLAVDAVRDRDMVKAGLQPDWGEAGYEILREEGERLGLQVGLKKKDGTRWDFGHVQIPVAKLVGVQERDLLLALKDVFLRREHHTEHRALKACWKYLDTKVPSFPW